MKVTLNVISQPSFPSLVNLLQLKFEFKSTRRILNIPLLQVIKIVM